jgi:hypothetical protein
MNKKILAGIVTSLVLGGIALANPVMANEGIVFMKGAGVSGACFAASVFVDGTYRVLVTCRDLKTALSPEQNRYVVWLTEENGKTRRLGEIVNGKMAMSTDAKFTQLYVTAETDGYGNKPSDSILLAGPVQAINFDAGVVKSGENVIIAPTPTPKKAAVTPTKAAGEVTTKETTPNQGIGGALSTVLKIALFGFGALLLIVGVFSFISRKRAL